MTKKDKWRRLKSNGNNESDGDQKESSGHANATTKETMIPSQDHKNNAADDGKKALQPNTMMVIPPQRKRRKFDKRILKQKGSALRAASSESPSQRIMDEHHSNSHGAFNRLVASAHWAFEERRQ